MKNITHQERKKKYQNFKGSLINDEAEKRQFTLSEKYYIEEVDYKKETQEGVYNFTVISLFYAQNDEKITDLVIENHNSQSYTLVQQDGKEYLFFREFYYSISLYDITARKLYAYETTDSLKTITHYYPSPDGLKMAVECYDYDKKEFIEVYDISNITSLPYPIVFERTLKLERGEVLAPIVWDNNRDITITTQQNIHLCGYSLKVKVVDYDKSGFPPMLYCRVQDIHGTIYTLFEKNEAMFGFIVDEKTKLPLNGLVGGVDEKYRIENGRKIYTVYDYCMGIEPEVKSFEVFEEQIQINWRHKNKNR